MSRHNGVFDLSTIQPEDEDVEYKKALGRDGRGAIPDDMWETYSAMANTDGGTIILGVEQDKRTKLLNLVGIPSATDAERLRKQIWDSLHNRQIVSVCLPSSQDVSVFEFENKQFVRVYVPRASRSQRPVYIKQNPLTGTFRRRGEGDYRCDEQTVKRMMADASDQPFDSIIVRNFNLDDFDTDSVGSYRNELRSTNPNHPFLRLDDIEFLRSLGAWRRDREGGVDGPTYAGLLMFGKLTSIKEALPHYHLDYQEREHGSSRYPWLDRVTTDYTWPGNLYSFFQRVYPKLTRELKVPFQLAPSSMSQRIDETEVHVALREALVNCLIHADYSGSIGILIHKRPDMFGFLNPGGLRLALDEIMSGGGLSDCRNPKLQGMFLLIGKAEKSGSGIPKILRGWQVYHKSVPLLSEKIYGGSDCTMLVLPLESLLPPQAVADLEQLFGERMAALDEIERIAMVIAYNEKRVTNERLRLCTSEHSHSISQTLRGLVAKGLLQQDGVGRGTWYYVTGTVPFDEGSNESPFNAPGISRSTEPDANPVGMTLIGEGVLLNREGRALNREGNVLNGEGRPLIGEAETLAGEDLIINSIADEVRSTQRAPRAKVEDAIVRICAIRQFSCKNLSILLNRTQKTLGETYLRKLVQEKRLRHTIPGYPGHPDQEYRTVGRADD